MMEIIEQYMGEGAASPLFWIVLLIVGGSILAKYLDKWFRK